MKLGDLIWYIAEGNGVFGINEGCMKNILLILDVFL